MPPLALVTGASRGIGRAIARALAPGHALVLSGRDQAALAAVAAELRPLAADARELAVLREQLQELAGQPVDEVVPELCGERRHVTGEVGVAAEVGARGRRRGVAGRQPGAAVEQAAADGGLERGQLHRLGHVVVHAGGPALRDVFARLAAWGLATRLGSHSCPPSSLAARCGRAWR